MGIKLFPGAAAPDTVRPAPPAPTQAERDQQFIAEQDARRQEAAPPAPPAPPAPVAAAPARPSTPPAAPRRAPQAYPDAEGVGDRPAPDDNGARLPFANTFGPLAAGRYTFLGAVEAIVHWEFGPAVALRVRVGPEAGREFSWEQTPPKPARENPEGGFAVRWYRDLFGAYTAGGWPADPDEATGWLGWPRSAKGDYTPPYADFFVTEVDGRIVPVVIEFIVQVDKGYESRPKIVTVRQHTIGGVLVQAPMPRKVTPWIAERHGWAGVERGITLKSGQHIPSVELQWDQIPRGVGGLLGLKDCRP